MEKEETIAEAMKKDARIFGASLCPNGIRSATALAASFVGYALMEDSVQNSYDDGLLSSEKIHSLVMSLPDTLREPLQYQGSDFASAYLHASCFGVFPIFLMKKTADTMPGTAAAKFLDQHMTAVRDGIGFSVLVGYETFQTAFRDKPIDLLDLAAYTAGIAVFGYGHKIAHGLYEASKDICIGTKQLLLPTPQEKLEKQLRL